MTSVNQDKREVEVYSSCTTKEKVLTLGELCQHCPIPARIQGGLPRVQAEIEIQHQGNTKDGFLKYCRDSLDNHVKKAAQYANDLANPSKDKYQNVGQCLEIKFWNLAVCELYKAELEKLPNSAAATANPFMTFELVPSEVAESHAYFTDLLSVCAKLPPHDVAHTLRKAFEQYRAKGFYAWVSFVERLPTYIRQHLSGDVQKMLEAPGGILSSFRMRLRIAELQPETWPFWGIDDRLRILERQRDIKERLDLAQQESRSVHTLEHTENLARLSHILIKLDAAKEAGNFVVNASELNALSSTTPIGQQVVCKSELLQNAAELQILCSKVLQHPSFVEELSLYQKSELLTYAEQEKMNYVRLAVELVDNNPDFVYPSAYKNGRETDYWMEKNASYQDYVRVLQLLHRTSSPITCVDLAAPTTSQSNLFTKLLRNYTLEQLHELLQKLGLIGADGQAIPAATPGAWVGVIHGLLDAQPSRLRNNKAAIQRAFSGYFGAVVGERAVQAGLGKRGSEAERVRDSTLTLLRGRNDAD